MQDTPYLSLNELAKYASLSVKTLRKYLTHTTHPLPHYRLPGKIFIRREDFDRWIAHYRCAPGERLDLGAVDRQLETIVNDFMKGL